MMLSQVFLPNIAILDLIAFFTSFVSQLVTIIIVGFKKFVIQQGNLIVVKECERHIITAIFLNSFTIHKFIHI